MTVDGGLVRANLREVVAGFLVRLGFQPFPCLRLAYQALAAGGTAPAVLNAANEVAVAAFLDGRSAFLDIPALVTTFVKRFSDQIGKVEPKITQEAFDMLLNYGWPGNIRELQNAVEYSVILADREMISEKQLPKEIQLPPVLQNVAAKSNGGGTNLNLDEHEKETILKALAQAHGNKKKAAEILGIHRPTLYSKLKRYEIQL